MTSSRRFSYVFLCIVPFLNFVVVGVRAFRVPGVYQSIGVVYFIAITVAAWILGARALLTKPQSEQRLALAGLLLMLPSALMALFWVGLGPPWEATPVENRMRYFILVINSVAVTGGFVVLEQALQEAGERLYANLGAAFALLAGAAYLVWNCLFLGLYVSKVRVGGSTPAAFVSLSDSIDALIFVACILTYLAALIFAVCLGRVRWLGRGGTLAYVIANLLLLVLILIKGLSYPDPTSKSAPWYLNLGFIAGIPAVPWIMPYLLGVLLLRRSGFESKRTSIR
jgi:hypothetical protein